MDIDLYNRVYNKHLNRHSKRMCSKMMHDIAVGGMEHPWVYIADNCKNLGFFYNVDEEDYYFAKLDYDRYHEKGIGEDETVIMYPCSLVRCFTDYQDLLEIEGSTDLEFDIDRYGE